MAAPCCLAEWLNSLSHGGLLRWANEVLISYWHFLNAIFSLSGWKYGFGSFWNYHPFLAMTTFLGIPIVGGITTFLVLKRARLAASIILFLYAWHYGLSTFVHTPTQWMTLLIVAASLLGCLLGFRLVHLLRSTFSSYARRDGFNNVEDKKSFLNYRHRRNEDILHKVSF